MRALLTRPRLTAAASLAVLAIAGCGDEGETTTAPGREAWTADAEEICATGLDEATALPLPQSKRQLRADARARAGILTTVREEIEALGTPEDVDPNLVGDYLAELDADIRQLNAIASGRTRRPLDEAAGSLARRLRLRDCAALANAIARTP